MNLLIDTSAGDKKITLWFTFGMYNAKELPSALVPFIGKYCPLVWKLLHQWAIVCHFRLIVLLALRLAVKPLHFLKYDNVRYLTWLMHA